MIKLIKSAFIIDNLSASAFLNASGKLIKLVLESLQERPSGIAFSRFDCRIDPTQEDARIQQDPLYFQFSLRLPQQNFDTITNKVEDISAPAKTKIQWSARKSGGVSAIIGKVSQLFSTPARTGTRNTQTAVSSQKTPTPKNERHF